MVTFVMAYELNDSEPSIYEVLNLRPPAPSILKPRKPAPSVQICLPARPAPAPSAPIMSVVEPELPQAGLWTVKHVCAFSQFCRSWVYKQVELGALPHVRKGRSVRFDPKVIREFFAEKRQGRR